MDAESQEGYGVGGWEGRVSDGRDTFGGTEEVAGDINVFSSSSSRVKACIYALHEEFEREL